MMAATEQEKTGEKVRGRIESFRKECYNTSTTTPVDDGGKQTVQYCCTKYLWHTEAKCYRRTRDVLIIDNRGVAAH